MRVTNEDLSILAAKLPQYTALMHVIDLSGLERPRIGRIFSIIWYPESSSSPVEGVKPDSNSTRRLAHKASTEKKIGYVPFDF